MCFGPNTSSCSDVLNLWPLFLACSAFRSPWYPHPVSPHFPVWKGSCASGHHVLCIVFIMCFSNGLFSSSFFSFFFTNGLLLDAKWHLFQLEDKELDIIEMAVYGDVIRPGNQCRCRTIAEMLGQLKSKDRVAACKLPFSNESL